MKLTITKQFQDFLASVGADFATVLEKAQLPNKLWQEEITFTAQDYYRFMVTLDTLLSDENLIALSQISSLQQFMPAFFAALSSPDGLTAVKRFAQFKPVVAPVDVNLTEEAETITINFSYQLPNCPLPRFMVLNEQLLLLSLLRTGTGKQLLPLQVSSPYPYGDLITAAFGTTPTSSSDNHMTFAKSDLAQPFLTENNIMWDYLKPALLQKLAENQAETPTIVSSLRQEILASLASGDFAIETIAKRLGLSARTLQRKLKEAGTSYQHEVQAIQKSMTFSYLEKQLPTEEITYLVGYTETSSFLRAFKKWTGQTLIEYKTQLA